jgi:hypothetical protein
MLKVALKIGLRKWPYRPVNAQSGNHIDSRFRL